jgi:MFS family permease
MRRTGDDPRYWSQASLPAEDKGQTGLKILTHFGLTNFQLLQCMLAIVFLLHAADGAMLPAIFKTLEEKMHGATPVSLGNITLVEALCHSSAVLFWGVIVDKGCKLSLLMYSMFAWGALTFATALVDDILSLAVVRSLAGIVGAALGPLSQGLIGVTCQPQERGKAFGYIIGFGQAGYVCGLMLAGTTSHLEAIGGWRGSFLFFAIFTIGLAWVISMVRVEVRTGLFAESRTWARLHRTSSTEWDATTVESFFGDIAMTVRTIFGRRSFLVLLVQGAFASTTLKAMHYQVMWYQYLGFSDLASSSIASAIYVGCMVGAFTAGPCADKLARLYPKHGRIAFGQFTDGAKLSILVLTFILCGTPNPNDPSVFCVRVSLSFFFGFMSIMAYASVVKPLFVEIVPANMIAQVIALAAAIDGAFSSFASTPVVGMVTENIFGYTRTRLSIHEMPESLRRANADALGHAIGSVAIVSTVLTILSFCFLHFTYPKDIQQSEEDDDSEEDSVISHHSQSQMYATLDRAPKRVSFASLEEAAAA